VSSVERLSNSYPRQGSEEEKAKESRTTTFPALDTPQLSALACPAGAKRS
jgi:hypothetical protein